MTNSTALHSANRWLIVIFTLLMVVTAALAGNGLFKAGSMEWLVTGHQHIGNLLFAMAVAQLAISYVLWTRKAIGGGVMLTSALIFLFTFGQIGLGYSTRSHMVDIVGWHIALGVALTAATAVMSTQMWTTSPANGANSTT